MHQPYRASSASHRQHRLYLQVHRQNPEISRPLACPRHSPTGLSTALLETMAGRTSEKQPVSRRRTCSGAEGRTHFRREENGSQVMYYCIGSVPLQDNRNLLRNLLRKSTVPEIRAQSRSHPLRTPRKVAVGLLDFFRACPELDPVSLGSGGSCVPMFNQVFNHLVMHRLGPSVQR